MGFMIASNDTDYVAVSYLFIYGSKTIYHRLAGSLPIMTINPYGTAIVEGATDYVTLSVAL